METLSGKNGNGAADRDLPENEEELDVEMALLAMSEDTGGPMADVDLSALSLTEKRALLLYLRQHLGIMPQNPQ